MSLWEQRDAPPRVVHTLEQAGIHPLLARVWAARGIRQAEELDDHLQHLLPPQHLHQAEAAAQRLAQAIALGEAMCIVADYDCDGATACAVAWRGLRLLGAQPEQLHYVVPDRSVHGYGLTPAIVDLAVQQAGPGGLKLLITVDNGIASVEGVAHARALGLSVLVTDHHLPADQRPDAQVIVNPNQAGCDFGSKHLAGVGVMFYVLLALRSEWRRQGRYSHSEQPRLDSLLDLVALGTVADVVRLDANNRRLVSQGLKRIRAGRMQAGIRALFKVAGRECSEASAQDFGFTLGPRLNAAGRLADMTLGIECLITDDPARAEALALTLDGINRDRRKVESAMREQADAQLGQVFDLQGLEECPSALTVFDERFHEGVVGIVAGRLKDRLHRPVFVLARAQDGSIKGSGRSIEGFHLRDALDWVSKRAPGVLLRFGGHAMAAGCTLHPQRLPEFTAALQEVAGLWMDEGTLQRRWRTDGPLPPGCYHPEVAQLLAQQVWGQGFEAPLFCDEVQVLSQRRVGENHLKLVVKPLNDLRAAPREAIWFQREEAVADRARLAYRLELNEWQGRQQVQMRVQAGEALGP